MNHEEVYVTVTRAQYGRSTPHSRISLSFRCLVGELPA